MVDEWMVGRLKVGDGRSGGGEITWTKSFLIGVEGS
jgi:hypothetical protein